MMEDTALKMLSIHVLCIVTSHLYDSGQPLDKGHHTQITSLHFYFSTDIPCNIWTGEARQLSISIKYHPTDVYTHARTHTHTHTLKHTFRVRVRVYTQTTNKPTDTHKPKD